MDNLEYSNDALEVKGAFYNKQITIYVEGIDDPLFWSEVLNIVNKEAHIEDVGGCEELAKYIKKIIEEGANFYVATDRDHSDFMDENYLDCEKVLFTYGYSIENSMYKSEVLNKIIIKYSKKPNVNNIEEIELILNNFAEKIENLILYDIANRKYDKGVQIFGDSCQRFLKNKNSTEICEKKVEDFINQVNDKFSENELKNVRLLVDGVDKHKWFLIKGHFISSLILNIVKSFTKKLRGKDISLSHEDLYTHAIDSMKDNQQDEDILYLINETEKINYA